LNASPPAPNGPFFGDHLEKDADTWIGAGGWEFRPGELCVRGGEVGLIDGEGYADYRFEFDCELPKEGMGVCGWVVRAQSENDCLMFQLQSADSPYKAPQFKTRPNTLRPHIRRNGEWTILDPVPLPKEIRRVTFHHVTVVRRGDTVEVSLDGTRVHTQSAPGMTSGAVGFRAGGPAEEGLFRNISLSRLED
jgi:hypothetical protein